MRLIDNSYPIDLVYRYFKNAFDTVIKCKVVHIGRKCYKV